MKNVSAEFTSPVHNERVSARLGLALGVTFTICFITGLYSHFAQHPSWGFQLPARPAGLYRFTQGLHVMCGIASIPLLFAKLWSVYPQLFQWPPFRGFAHAVERLMIIPLVAGSIFLLFTGLANIHLWYPWRFNFPDTHFRAAWVTMGALAVHIGAKWSTTGRALARESADATTPAQRLDRRRFLATAFGASAIVTLFSAGETFRPLARLALLSPRRADTGTQGFPVNATAKEAGVLDLARSPSYRLTVEGNVPEPLALSLDELRALPQHSATLPIACVEGWSASRRWTGVQLRELLTRAGAPDNARVRVESFQTNGINLVSDVDRSQAHDPDTLLALQVDGEPLALDHGYPCRLIGPNRPGVLQTKWVGKVVVL
jgi:DMSO/TMAO reductase YedYZ molybdopterin-dependent catalytic subunit